MSTNVNNLAAEAKALDPLGILESQGHLLPVVDTGEASDLDLTAEKRKEKELEGSQPLTNQKHEEFCQYLTGWVGDGQRMKAYAAYEKVYSSKGKSIKSPRSLAARLMAQPEVAARIKYLDAKVEAMRRHDYRAAQREIDELRLSVIARASKNSKMIPLALIAARDFEKAHGLDESESADEETKSLSIAETDGFGSIRAAILKVTRKKKPE